MTLLLAAADTDAGEDPQQPQLCPAEAPFGRHGFAGGGHDEQRVGLPVIRDMLPIRAPIEARDREITFCKPFGFWYRVEVHRYQPKVR